ncbi:MAG: hypothetical protein NVSMB32_16830 [Actinomycetota bacterium]
MLGPATGAPPAGETMVIWAGVDGRVDSDGGLTPWVLLPQAVATTNNTATTSITSDRH